MWYLVLNRNKKDRSRWVIDILHNYRRPILMTDPNSVYSGNKFVQIKLINPETIDVISSYLLSLFLNILPMILNFFILPITCSTTTLVLLNFLLHLLSSFSRTLPLLLKNFTPLSLYMKIFDFCVSWISLVSWRARYNSSYCPIPRNKYAFSAIKG